MRRITLTLIVGSSLLFGFLLGSYRDTLFQGTYRFSKSAAGNVSQISFAELADQVTPSVVSVVSTKYIDFSQVQDGQEVWPQIKPEGENRRKSLGYGSGFIIDGHGLILTNDHVIDDARRITVRLSDGKEFPAKLVGADKETDLALLMIRPRQPLQPARMGDSDKLRVGDWVMAVGNPYNYEHTVTVGVISAKDRRIDDNPFERYIQTDAAINYGNSGGPLFNSQGEVVAINCAISTKARGIGFSIPINHAKEIVRQLEQQGRVVRGYLGLGPDSITEEYARLLHLPSRQGILVVEVSPDSAAAKSGIRRYDAITEINGKPILGRDDFFHMIAGTPPGTLIRLKGLRDHKGIEFDVVVRERQPISESQIVPARPEENRPDPINDASQSGLGIAVQEVSTEHRRLFHLEESQGGVLIVSITPFGPAADAGLAQGEIILEINRLPIRSLSDYQRVISQCKREEALILLVSRPNNSARLVTVRPSRNQP